MDIEDEILEELQDKERLIARLISENTEKKVALKEKEQEKELALKEKDQEKKLALKEQEKTLVINAYQSGLDDKTIAKITQLNIETIKKIISKL